MAEMRGDLRVNGARGKLSAASGKRKLSSIKAFFRFLVKEKVIEVNPAENISGPKLPKRLPVFVREEEMECTLDDAEKKKGFSGLRDFLILLMAYDTGMRRSEIIGLKVGNVDLSRRSCFRERWKMARNPDRDRVDAGHRMLFGCPESRGGRGA